MVFSFKLPTSAEMRPVGGTAALILTSGVGKFGLMLRNFTSALASDFPALCTQDHVPIGDDTSAV
jgi:hypothetical protein